MARFGRGKPSKGGKNFSPGEVVWVEFNKQAAVCLVLRGEARGRRKWRSLLYLSWTPSDIEFLGLLNGVALWSTSRYTLVHTLSSRY